MSEAPSRCDESSALAALRQASAASPHDRDLALALARRLEASGLADEAETRLRDALDLLPDDALLRGELVRLERARLDRLLAACVVHDDNYEARDYAVTALVSIYRAGAHIRDCLSDLTSQTLGHDLEILIVDADSPDDELSEVRRFQARHPNIRCLRAPSRISIYAAWNLAAHAARGRCLTPFSANDRLLPDAYSVMLRALDEEPAAALVFGDSFVTHLPGQTVRDFAPCPEFGGAWRWGDYLFAENLLEVRVGPHPMWRTGLHGEFGFFDERYLALSDQDFWLRLGRRRLLRHLPVFTGLYWYTPDSLSSRGEREFADISRRHRRIHCRDRLA